MQKYGHWSETSSISQISMLIYHLPRQHILSYLQDAPMASISQSASKGVSSMPAIRLV
jgi:hypothetical protein